MTDTSCKIQLSNLGDARLAQLTRELERDLPRIGVRVKPAVPINEAGDRGDVVTLGVIFLALINGGAITSLIDCLKAYLSRESKLQIKITDKDGKSIEINGSNVSSAKTRGYIEQLQILDH